MKASLHKSRAARALALVLALSSTAALGLPGGTSTPRSIREAQANSEVPPAMRGVDVEEHLGEAVPLATEFSDEAGRPVKLGALFPPGKPVVLTLVYYQCPMLCNLVLNEQVRAMKEVGLQLGRDYHAITVSIDPKDTPAQSAMRRARHLQAMGQPKDAPWRFLTGGEASIHALASAVGFQYTYDADTKQFAHPAVVHVLSPEGTISRYLYGTSFQAKDLRFALIEAAGGRVGTSFDRVVLSCFKYDTATRRYGFYIFGFLRLGALTVFGALSAMLAILWRRELKKG